MGEFYIIYDAETILEIEDEDVHIYTLEDIDDHCEGNLSIISAYEIDRQPDYAYVNICDEHFVDRELLEKFKKIMVNDHVASWASTSIIRENTIICECVLVDTIFAVLETLDN